MTALIVGTDFKDGYVTGACSEVEYQDLWIIAVFQFYRLLVCLVRVDVTYKSSIWLVNQVLSCHGNLVGS